MQWSRCIFLINGRAFFLIPFLPFTFLQSEAHLSGHHPLLLPQASCSVISLSFRVSTSLLPCRISIHKPFRSLITREVKQNPCGPFPVGLVTLHLPPGLRRQLLEEHVLTLHPHLPSPLQPCPLVMAMSVLQTARFIGQESLVLLTTTL